MTATGSSKVLTLVVTTDTPVDIAAEFNIFNPGGIKFNRRAGFWITNMDTTAANVVWFRLDNVIITGSAQNDCLPCRAGERVYVRAVPFIHLWAAAGTPIVVIAGDESGGVVYS